MASAKTRDRPMAFKWQSVAFYALGRYGCIKARESLSQKADD